MKFEFNQWTKAKRLLFEVVIAILLHGLFIVHIVLPILSNFSLQLNLKTEKQYDSVDQTTKAFRCGISVVDLEQEEEENNEIEELIEEEEVPEENEIEEFSGFYIQEKYPEPEIGMKAYYEFVKNNLHYPEIAIQNKIEGRVYIQFNIEANGTISDVKTIRGIGYRCDAEAERVLKLAPKWIPAKQRNKAIKQRMIIPINFKLDK